jgi:hypothetical protein
MRWKCRQLLLPDLRFWYWWRRPTYSALLQLDSRWNISFIRMKQSTLPKNAEHFSLEQQDTISRMINSYQQLDRQPTLGTKRGSACLVLQNSRRGILGAFFFFFFFFTKFHWLQIFFVLFFKMLHFSKCWAVQKRKVQRADKCEQKPTRLFFGVAKITQPVLARIDSSRCERATILLQHFAAGQQLRLQIWQAMPSYALYHRQAPANWLPPT